MYISLLLLEGPLIAKSNIILAVKPWDDETDMKELERVVREVTTDGLVWGACKACSTRIVCNHTMSEIAIFFAAKLVPVAYGIQKLQISCVVEDDKVNNGCNVDIFLVKTPCLYQLTDGRTRYFVQNSRS